ncbi:MAG: DUF4160 domain-containing protein [Oscillospiraceae bacterium]
MPELSRFLGIVIKLLFDDNQQHNTPHIHATYGEYKASISLDGNLLAGSMPAKQFKLIVGWLVLHEGEVQEAWNKAVNGEQFNKIPPALL